ncbi:hypothetical protein BC830DRAFT_1130009 [Chytriomyces sp. MP71]|nr:hypothetical protein BC830DRAFT_1130009 [Chytriomyces sp. MP71]
MPTSSIKHQPPDFAASHLTSKGSPTLANTSLIETGLAARSTVQAFRVVQSVRDSHASPSASRSRRETAVPATPIEPIHHETPAALLASQPHESSNPTPSRTVTFKPYSEDALEYDEDDGDLFQDLFKKKGKTSYQFSAQRQSMVPETQAKLPPPKSNSSTSGKVDDIFDSLFSASSASVRNESQLDGTQAPRGASSATQKPNLLATRLSLLTGPLNLPKPRLASTLSADDLTRPTAVNAATQQREPNKMVEVTAFPSYSIDDEARGADSASVLASLAPKETRRGDSEEERAAQPPLKRAKIIAPTSQSAETVARAPPQVKTVTQRARGAVHFAAPHREHKNAATVLRPSQSVTKAHELVPPSDDDMPCDDGGAAERKDANDALPNGTSIVVELMRGLVVKKEAGKVEAHNALSVRECVSGLPNFKAFRKNRKGLASVARKPIEMELS